MLRIPSAMESERTPEDTLYMGPHYAVVLSTYEAVHEAFVEKGSVFNHRPKYLLFKVFEHEKAFPVNDGGEWRVMRNFSMNTLKNLGFGKAYTKNFVQIEIQDLIGELKRHEGVPLNVDEMLSKSGNQLILSLFTGKRYDRSDHSGWAAQVTATAAELSRAYAYDITSLFPWIRKIPLVNRIAVSSAVRTLKKRLWALIEEEIGTLKTLEPETFIHAWYLEREKKSKRNDPYNYLFSDFDLVNTIDLLVQASSDTTSTTLLWAFLFLILHPDVQEQLHREIDEQLGPTREPTLEDMRDMHYTKAFLTEVHRRGTIVPMGAFHSNRVKGELKGFEIPRDSLIISLLWSIHHDPDHFPEPYTFDPERFLDGERKFKPCEHVSPFSFGRRQCPGKQVAEISVFLYLTSILQVFEQ